MELFDPSLFNSTLRMVAPILLAALGGMLCTRVGIFNVGLEGMVLIGAFSAIVGNALTGNILFAVTFAALMSMLFGLLMALMTIQLKANEIIVGIAINFLALGLTTFLLRAIFDVKGAYYDKEMVGLPKWNIPFVENIPVIGPIFSGHSPLVYLALIAPFLLYIFLYRSVTGFRLLAVGYNQVATHSLGIRVKGLQYLALGFCGALCGLAGAQLSLGQVTMFTEGMTSGRGFISLVAMMLGQSHPIWILGSSFLFGLTDAISTRLQGFSVPTQFTSMIPYALTLLAMFFLKDKNSEMDLANQRSSR